MFYGSRDLFFIIVIMNIGIDFGTTNSSIAYINNNKLKLLQVKNKFKIPSIIYEFNNKLFTNYSNNFTKISHFKRQINNISYSQDNPKITEYVTFYLKFIKNIINKNLLFNKIDNISSVFSVPTSFNHYHRSWYKNILESLDFNVTRIISEPSAAAIAYYYFEKKSEAEKIIVIDLGGGTTDISVLEKDDQFYQVVFNKGDLYLGGEDFTQEICNNLNIRWDDGEKRKLENNIDDIKYYSKNLEKLNNLIKIVLNNVNLSEIDDIILVGNGLKLIGIMKLLKNYFGDKLRESEHQEYLVAYGTSILNKEINNVSSELIMIDSTSLSIGIETADLNFSIIIPANSALPATGVRKYLPSDENENEITLNIYQGEKSLAQDNEVVGKLIIPSNEKQYVDSLYQVMLKLDLNGIIYVKIKDLNDSNYYYDKVLKFKKSDNKDLEIEDNEMREFRKVKYEIKRIIQNIKLALEETNLTKEQKEAIIENIENLDNKSIDYLSVVKNKNDLLENYGHLQYSSTTNEINDKENNLNILTENYSDNLYLKYLKEKVQSFLDIEDVVNSESLKELINNLLENFNNLDISEINNKILDIENILENSDDYNEFKELIYFIEYQLESDNLDINEKQKNILLERLDIEKKCLVEKDLDYKQKILNFNNFCNNLL